MAQEYRRIDVVTLHPDKIITIKMKPHGGRWVEYDLTPQYVAVKFVRRDGNRVIRGAHMTASGSSVGSAR